MDVLGNMWRNTSGSSDGRARSCEAECDVRPSCIGYISEDTYACGMIIASEISAQGRISAVDHSSRNYCWKKDSILQARDEFIIIIDLK